MCVFKHDQGSSILGGAGVHLFSLRNANWLNSRENRIFGLNLTKVTLI